MSLQDNPDSEMPMIGPDGKPIPFGSPEYLNAVAPWMTKQIGREAQRASNARGQFYSGNAIADETQAKAGALQALAQQASAQSLQQQMMDEQLAAQAQQSRESNQAAQDIAGKQAKAQMLSGAVQGGTGALGTLGGLWAAKHLFGAGAAAHGAAAVAPAAAELAAPTGELANIVAASSPQALSEAPIGFNVAEGGTGVGQGAAMSSAAPASIGAGSLALGAIGALPASYYGANAGLDQFGHNDRNRAGAGVGGALGFGAGMALGGPLGGAAGAGAGSYIGAQLATHPGDLLLGPLAPIMGIPGVRGAASDVGNWIGDRLGI